MELPLIPKRKRRADDSIADIFDLNTKQSEKPSSSDLIRKNRRGDNCEICLQTVLSPVITPCLHKFCQRCIEESLKVQRVCPKCSQGPIDLMDLSPVNPFPADKAKEEENEVSRMFSDILRSNLVSSEIDEMIKVLSKKRAELNVGQTITSDSLVDVFTREFLRRKEIQLSNIVRQCDIIKRDRDVINSRILAASGRKVFTEPEPLDTLSDRMLKHFDGLQAYYTELLNRNHGSEHELSSTLCNECEGACKDDEERLDRMGNVIRGVAKYGQVERIAILNYDTEVCPQQSIVSSLEFDKEGELFVVAGVTKRIKIFNYENIVDFPDAHHYPLAQLRCRSKISNVSWSQFQRELMCSSDYDGTVSVWDINTQQVLKSFHEHEKRCWTVHFNNVDPHLIASGSDDAKVKIWSLNCDRSVTCIDAKVNVCCVCFSPTNKFNIAFGSADHTVHMYDIRQPSTPVSILKGHKKAVSYVRYVNDDQVVSASTDSTLRVWCAKTGRCIRILRGHINEKNFVGLSDNGSDHVMCGSENGSVYFYHKYISDPILASYVGKEETVGDPEGFISSVCWRKNSDVVVVANSFGSVQFLKLS
ncbi:unnamed protein product [Auanema sp. JU1783]|nr:unnamed protein product [Auanema sp. JU1783]